MARYYEFSFVNENGAAFTITGWGNTRRSAERSARSKLRHDKKQDPTKFRTLSCEYVQEDKR